MLNDLLCNSDEQTLSYVDDFIFVDIVLFILILLVVVVSLRVLRMIYTLTLVRFALSHDALRSDFLARTLLELFAFLVVLVFLIFVVIFSIVLLRI